MLNTIYHTKEDIEQAEKILNEVFFDAGTTDKDKEAYASILIFCNFDKVKAAKYYEKLCNNGVLLYSDLEPSGSSLVGWVL